MGFRRRSTGETTPAVETKTAAKGKLSYNRVGSLVEKKDGTQYIKFDESFDLAKLVYDGKPVKYLNMEDPTIKFDRQVASGKITEAEADEKAAKIPSYVLFEITAVTE